MGQVLRNSNPTAGMDLWGWEFHPRTMSLDCSSASKEEMIAALKDCYRCRAIEYPETKDGYEKAVERSEMIESWIMARWPDEYKQIREDVYKSADSISRVFYGRN